MRKTYTVVRYSLLFNKVVERMVKVGLAEAMSLVDDGNRVHRLLRTSESYRKAYGKMHNLSDAEIERLCTLSWAIEELLAK